MAQKIQIRSALKAELPNLDVGEFGFCTDTLELFIGSDNGNIQIVSIKETGSLSNLTTTDKNNLVKAINEIMKETNQKASITHTHSTEDIQDIETSQKSDGHVLTYDQNQNKFIPKPIQTSVNYGVINDLEDVDTTTIRPVSGDYLRFNDGMWTPDRGQINSSEHMGSDYLLELDRWNIKNDGTAAEQTSLGINNALKWAFDNNISEVSFPRGTYLIDENNPIEPMSYMELNLNGSTLKIRENGLTSYSIISFTRNQINSIIRNGIIKGDKDSHDYSSGGSHEGGYGIQVGSFTPPIEGGNNTRYIQLKDLEILDCTGDAITINSTFGQISPFPNALATSWESGGISSQNGSLTSDPNKVRSKLTIDLSQPSIMKYGYFGLYGNGYGNLGSDIHTDYYDVFFYDVNNQFLTSKKQVQFFDEVEVPSDAKIARVMLHQKKVPVAENCQINVRVPTFPQHTFIQKCNLHDCRRQGITLAGAKHVYIKDNHIHHIGGTPPQAGIDIEDGYDLNQHVHITGNDFHDNQSYDVVVVNGKSINISKNNFSAILGGGATLAINGGADQVSIEENHFKKAKVIIAGNVNFNENNLIGSQLNILGDYFNRPINLADNSFYNSKLVVDNPYPHLVHIKGCRFLNDFDKLNAFSNFQWTIELKGEPQIFSDCIFAGKDLYYTTYVLSNTKGGWLFEDCLFKTNTTLVGRYVNCKFLGDMTIFGVKENIADSIELINCKIISQDRNNALISAKNLKSIKLKNCHLEKPNGQIFLAQNRIDQIVLEGNSFIITDDSLVRPILKLDATLQSGVVEIKDNFISSKNKKQVGIENASTVQSLIVFKDNTLNNATIQSNGNEILLNNIVDGMINP